MENDQTKQRKTIYHCIFIFTAKTCYSILEAETLNLNTFFNRSWWLIFDFSFYEVQNVCIFHCYIFYTLFTKIGYYVIILCMCVLVMLLITGYILDHPCICSFHLSIYTKRQTEFTNACAQQTTFLYWLCFFLDSLSN